MLNIIWVSFFLIAFLVALLQWLVWGQGDVFVSIMGATFEMSRVAFEIALGLVGIMSFWMGIMRIGERAGVLDLFVRLLHPLLRKLFPEVPERHPAFGAMVMNFSANLLGLDNAATPLGLKAMNELQALNPEKHSATNAQILFLVLNTSSVTLFPVTVFVYRAQQGAADPTDVFLPILLATFCSTLVGLLAVAAVQRISMNDPVLLAYLGGLTALMGGLVWYFSQLDQAAMQEQSARLSNFLLFTVIVAFMATALWKKQNVFDVFIDGAKEGFEVAIKIVPYLVAMLVGIAVFRASGALEILLDGIRWLVLGVGGDTRFVDALPTAFMKPLSGSGARGMMIETMQTFGADSFAGRMASVMQGSTETTFYVLALYFGAVGVRRTRHALPCALLADAAGILAAILVSYWFFG
ncbi:nucleoside recognition domain-containing protein [Nitrospina gracilis]|uniref:nucleoside recognition domain-containing protein n=1 Tax=Nitrospina gracilis TaxID=35801 RepID=UPI001F35EBF4|nr:spore maturation protein [Nitrospina gracilis]MCF8720910.1 spore maturation protein SpmA [Nitrospina gracilis Nb-211]